MPPLKQGSIFFSICRSVGWSVDQVISAQYLYAPKLESCQIHTKDVPRE